MCDDVSSDYEKGDARITSTTSIEPEKCAAETETHAELSKQTEITRSCDGNNFKTFKGINKTRHKKSLKFQKEELISKNTGISNTKLTLRQSGMDRLNKNGDYENIITCVKDAERNDVCENSVTFSFQAEGKNGVSLPSDATNTVGSTRYSDKRGRFKIQRKNERRSSLLNVTLLPPLEEEKSARTSRTSPSVSPNIRSHTIGYYGEDNDIVLPSIVVSKAEEEVSWGEKTLKLPKIEAANSKGRYQRRLSLPEPNRLAPPIFQESSKAHRPPVLASTEDGSDCTRNAIRLPQIRPGSSVISGSNENGNQNEC